jgi:glycerophosphoryl diester phosphodiesterase
MTTISAVLMAAALLALWRGVLWLGRPLPGVTRAEPLLVGHRGVRGLVPENTVAAFRRALGAGLDGLETDVQRTRDGRLVLVHDEHVDGAAVTALTFDALRQRSADLATLDECFDVVRAYPGTWLNVELKTWRWFEPALAAAVARAIRASGLADRTLVSSFNPIALAMLRLHAPELRVGYLWSSDASTPRLLRTPWPAGWLHVDALHPHHTLVTEALLARSRRRGLALNTWTVNAAADVVRLRDMGVSGIMADDPNELLGAARGGSR